MMQAKSRFCSPPTRVLLATDLSNLKRLLPIAVAYARKFKAELKIAHVLPDPECSEIDPFLMVHADRAAVERYASKRLEGAVETAAKSGLACSSVMRSGRTTETLRQMVEEWKPDRVIVGCDAQKFGRDILNSTAESIMRALDVPVIAISPAAARRRGLTGLNPRILFAADLDRASATVVRSVVECAQIHEADLTVLQVIPEGGEEGAAALRARSAAERRFQETFAGLDPEGPRPSSMIEQGPVIESILRVARQERADLIVLADVKASSSRRGPLRNISYGVLCGAPCPVMTFKADPHAKAEQLPAAS